MWLDKLINLGRMLVGRWFHVTIGEHQLSAWGSYFSGREKIWIDDELVSDKRSYRFKSYHQITIDGEPVTIEFHMLNMFTGRLRLTATKGDECLGSVDSGMTLRQTFLIFIFCAIFGFLAGYFTDDIMNYFF